MNCLFSQMLDNVTCGDCTDVMSYMPARSVDFILTDPPYITRYRDRKGRRVLGDDNSDWLQPAFSRMYRLLKEGSFCISFYGWNRTGLFMTAWRSAGFRILGHIVFRKDYTSSTRFMQYRHEQAFLLGKGDVRHPVAPIRDVIDWTDYTGNRLHPTQKPLQILKPLIDSFTPPGGGRERYLVHKITLMQGAKSTTCMPPLLHRRPKCCWSGSARCSPSKLKSVDASRKYGLLPALSAPCLFWRR